MAWRPASEPPDADHGVLIYGPGWSEAEKGYYDGDARAWRYWDGGGACPVTHWRELPLPPSDRPTVRVRAACVVAADGAYEIRGSASQSDQRLVREAGEYLCDSPTRLAWLEANVPLPEPVEAETIEAEVSDG